MILNLRCGPTHEASFLAVISWCFSGDSAFDFQIDLGHIWTKDWRQVKVRVTVFSDSVIQNMSVVRVEEYKSKEI